jgi:exosome complex component RRP41
MAYEKRFDGRASDETRPIEAETGVIARARGSARFKLGHTEAIAAVYGPRELHPRFLQDPKRGRLRVVYNMLPFSGHGDRVRPGMSRRSKELCFIIERALRQVVNLDAFPNQVVDVYIDFPQTDAGTRCAGICAASMALADAGIEMKDMVSAVAVGQVHGHILADLTYDEEAYKTEDGGVADVPVAFINNTGELTLLQMDGEMTREELKKALELGKEVCKKIAEVQKQAVKARYEGS